MRRVNAAATLSFEAGAVPVRRRWMAPRWWRPAARTAARTARVGLALVLGAGVPAWAWSSGAAADAAQRLGTAALDLGIAAGLTVEDVLVEGRSRTRPGDLLAALGVQRGDPILAVDLVAAKERVEMLPWVAAASLERRLPGLLTLKIIERQPIALWQNHGAFILVDARGVAIADDHGDFDGLPLVVGEDAPQHAAELLAMLRSEPELSARVKAAVRVSGRRWNLVIDKLEGGINVRLPEADARGAWRRLATLEREHRLLDRAITAVDLRMPDRLVVRRQGIDQPLATPKRKTTGKDA